MAAYVIPFTQIAAGATANVEKTLVSVVVPASPAGRVRIRQISLGSDHPTPIDETFDVAIRRGDTDGTATAITAANVQKMDPGAPQSPASANREYTVEPTYETDALYQSAMNGRARLSEYWDPEAAPACITDQILGLTITPREGTNDSEISGHIVFEPF